MPIASSVVSWRGTPVVPSDYEDLRELTKVARRARTQIVDFAWAVTRDDLEQLRRAAFEWGKISNGGFKCFDARVLAAINMTLDDPRSVYTLQEPRDRLVGGLPPGRTRVEIRIAVDRVGG